MNSYQIDKKLEPVLRQIEENGVKLDVDLIRILDMSLILILQVNYLKFFIKS